MEASETLCTTTTRGTSHTTPLSPLPTAGAVFLTNKAYVQGALLWATLLPALAIYDLWCTRTHLQRGTSQPLSRATAVPEVAAMEQELWLPPALRPGALGWWPQGGLVWEKYGLSMYAA